MNAWGALVVPERVVEDHCSNCSYSFGWLVPGVWHQIDFTVKFFFYHEWKVPEICMHKDWSNHQAAQKDQKQSYAKALKKYYSKDFQINKKWMHDNPHYFVLQCLRTLI